MRLGRGLNREGSYLKFRLLWVLLERGFIHQSDFAGIYNARKDGGKSQNYLNTSTNT